MGNRNTDFEPRAPELEDPRGYVDDPATAEILAYAAKPHADRAAELRVQANLAKSDEEREGLLREAAFHQAGAHSDTKLAVTALETLVELINFPNRGSVPLGGMVDGRTYEATSEKRKEELAFFGDHYKDPRTVRLNGRRDNLHLH